MRFHIARSVTITLYTNFKILIAYSNFQLKPVFCEAIGSYKLRRSSVVEGFRIYLRLLVESRTRRLESRSIVKLANLIQNQSSIRSDTSLPANANSFQVRK
jgi:hypothetical protein